MTCPCTGSSIQQCKKGEGRSQPWKTASDYQLWDEEENFDDEVLILFELPGKDDDGEEVEYVTKAVLGLEASKKFPAKVMTEEE